MKRQSGAAAASQGFFHMLIVRLREGVTSHFKVRLSEWLMLAPAFGMWAALNIQPDMFSVSQSYSYIAWIADEKTWSLIVLACAILRALALFVNGTFDEFKYSPHVRMFASLAGATFWAYLSLGFLQGYVSNDGAIGPFFTYGSFVIFELANYTRSSMDVGTTYAQTKARQRKNGRLGVN